MGRRLRNRGWALILGAALLLPASASLAFGPLPAPVLPLGTSQGGLAAMLVQAADAHPDDPVEAALAAGEVALAQRLSWVGGLVPAGAAPLLVQAQRDLATARALAGLASPDADLAQGVAAARLATRWQAASLGLAVPASSQDDAHASPSEAVEALAALRSFVLTEDARAQALALDQLPEPLRGALLRLLDAFLALDAASLRAYAHADVAAVQAFRVHPPPPEALTASPRAADPGAVLRGLGLDLAPVLGARTAFLDAALDFQEAARRAPPPTDGSFDLSPVVALDLSGADSTYTRDYALLVDVGGDDAYRNNAGGNGLRPPLGPGGPFQDACRLPSAAPPDAGLHGAAALLDLAGDDTYGDLVEERGCGVIGGGYLGTGMLVDADGNDEYLAGRGGDVNFDAGSEGANGGGFGGLGLLLDQRGDDTYVAGHHGTNGGGLYGAGLLLDMAGADTYYSGPINFEGYQISSFSGNGGGFLGTGFLVDMDGPDAYDGGSFGGNGGGFDGYGFLFDFAGDDRYKSLSSGSGGGANHGSGFIFDGTGDDLYEAGIQGNNGGGFLPPAVGFLLDGAGNDRYLTHQRGTNGGADEPGGLGLLLDLDGDDLYSAGDRATNGGGSEGGVGLLFDRRGDDTYLAGSKGANGGGWIALVLPGVGFLHDGDGADFYQDAFLDPACWDCTVVPKDASGAMLDSDSMAQTVLDQLMDPLGPLGRRRGLQACAGELAAALRRARAAA